MLAFLSLACVVSVWPALAEARAPASVNFENRKRQCAAYSCACGVCERCSNQAEREACVRRAKEPEVTDTGENGVYDRNDDNDLVTEDRD